MTDVIRILQREHASIETLIKSLEWQLAEFERGETPDYDVIKEIINYFLSFPDIYHHPKEDIIFAQLKSADRESASLVGDLRHDHEQLTVRTREFADGIHAVLEEAQVPRESLLRWGRRFIELQRQHMDMEETVFFPTAKKVLKAEDWQIINSEINKHDDPLVDDKVKEHFEALCQKILTWQDEQGHG